MKFALAFRTNLTANYDSNNYTVPIASQAPVQVQTQAQNHNKKTTHTRPKLAITTTPSTAYSLYVLALHSLAGLAIILPEQLPLFVPLIAIPLLLSNAKLMFSETRCPTSLVWEGNDAIEINKYNIDGTQKITGMPTARSLHCYWFILLEIQESADTCTRIVLPRDALPVADYRRLRARLQLSQNLQS